MFTTKQIDLLIHRLRQTPEELLYDKKNKSRAPYNHKQRKGATILGVAHCDYVRSAWSYPKAGKSTDGHDIITAGQVDDRVGVWLLLDVLPGLIPTFDVLLTDDEEIGRSTAEDFGVENPGVFYNWTFQFDRRGVDFVDYGKASKRFIRNFKSVTGIAHGMGSFSDICYLPASCGSKVNIGTGYYNEHTPEAFVDLQQCFDQVARFARFAKKFYEKPFNCPIDNWDDMFPSARKSKKLDDSFVRFTPRTSLVTKGHKCGMCEEFHAELVQELCDTCYFKVYGDDMDLARKGSYDIGSNS